MTTHALLQAILSLLPDAVLGEDEDGQLIIYTGLEEGPDEKVRDLTLDLPSECGPDRASVWVRTGLRLGRGRVSPNVTACHRMSWVCLYGMPGLSTGLVEVR